MSDAPPPKSDPNGPFWRWAAILIGIVGFVVALSFIFPNAVTTPGDWSGVAYGVGLVLLLCAGGLGLRRQTLGTSLRYAAIWLAIFGGLTIVVTMFGLG